MPWTKESPPSVAKNWTDEEKEKCVKAANAVLEETGDDEKAIQACIHAAGKSNSIDYLGLIKIGVVRAPQIKFDWTAGTQTPIYREFWFKGPIEGRHILVYEEEEKSWRLIKPERQIMDSEAQIRGQWIDRPRHRITAVVLEPEVEGPDGYSASAEDIELAAYKYMTYLQSGKKGLTTLEHVRVDPATSIVESYIAPVSFVSPNGEFVLKGSWIVTSIPSASTWARVEKGEFVGLSLRAQVRVLEENETEDAGCESA